MATFPLAEPPSPVAAPGAPRGAMVPAPYRIVRQRRETHDTWTVELEPDDQRLGAFAPGQFAMLYAFGTGEAPISVSGDLEREGPLVHTIRAMGPVTSALCAARPGDAVGVRGPFGTAWPVEQAVGADLVVVAGGIGLAPLRPVMYKALAHRQRYGAVALLYGGRSPAELLYAEEVAQWRGRFDVDLDVRVTVDSAGPDWRGRVGVVTELLAGARFDPSEAVAMICGPEVMMRFAVAALHDRGVPLERIWISMERSMRCAIGLCGHCMLGPEFVCKDGAVFRYDRLERFLKVRAL